MTIDINKFKTEPIPGEVRDPETRKFYMKGDNLSYTKEQSFMDMGILELLYKQWWADYCQTNIVYSTFDLSKMFFGGGYEFDSIEMLSLISDSLEWMINSEVAIYNRDHRTWGEAGPPLVVRGQLLPIRFPKEKIMGGRGYHVLS